VFTLKKDDKTTDKLSMNLNENQYRQIEKFLPVKEEM
jgi:hypothetical protein